MAIYQKKKDSFMSSNSNSSPQPHTARPRDRFDDLALFYAECYLGRDQVKSLLEKSGANSETEPKTGYLERLGRSLGRFIGTRSS